jgi:hypothetical protein
MSSSHRHAGRSRGWAIVAVVSALTTLVTIVALLLDSSSARAATGEPGGHLVVHSDRGMPAEFAAFSPGDVEQWHLTSSVTGAPSSLFLRVDRSGALVDRPGGLQLAVSSCAGAWSAAGDCSAGTPVVVVAPTALRSTLFDTPLGVGRLAAGGTSHLQLTLSLPAASEGDSTLMGLAASVDVQVTASGIAPGGTTPSTPGTVAAGPPAGGAGETGNGGGLPAVLAWTGSQAGVLGIVAAGFLAVGILTLALRRRRTRSEE